MPPVFPTKHSKESRHARDSLSLGMTIGNGVLINGRSTLLVEGGHGMAKSDSGSGSASDSSDDSSKGSKAQAKSGEVKPNRGPSLALEIGGRPSVMSTDGGLEVGASTPGATATSKSGAAKSSKATGGGAKSKAKTK